ncbi:MAG: hypothetical protein Kow0092_19910 [Deferrisomatales bacterium]
MRKLATAAAAVLFALTPVLGVAGADGVKPPDHPIEILTEGAKKPAVVFDHAKHFAANEGLAQSCETCHHKPPAEGGCRTCHGLEADGEKVKIKDAMHKKGAGKCYQCHFPKDAKKKLKCNDCHKK